jgi:hypothetical protein
MINSASLLNRADRADVANNYNANNSNNAKAINLNNVNSINSINALDKNSQVAVSSGAEKKINTKQVLSLIINYFLLI